MNNIKYIFTINNNEENGLKSVQEEEEKVE